ncbi:MAG: heparan-alpha-glucosaminide N-acetyltransferase [Burkholderiales bacterium]
MSRSIVTESSGMRVGLRALRVDALRGAAMVWMAAFHLSFDLSHFGLWPGQNFYFDVRWTGQRAAIVSLFLFCVGLGQALAAQRDQPAARFWRRQGQIAACALLVSMGSWLMFPGSFISFGVLHGMVVMLVLLRLLARLPDAALAALGLLALLAPALWQHPFFDTRWTDWIGLVTHKPRTEDFVPVLPWLGVMLWGLAAGRQLLHHRPGWLGAGLPGLLHPLAKLGQWPLSFYMLHQPVLIGLVLGWQWLTR